MLARNSTFRLFTSTWVKQNCVIWCYVVCGMWYLPSDIDQALSLVWAWDIKFSSTFWDSEEDSLRRCDIQGVNNFNPPFLLQWFVIGAQQQMKWEVARKMLTLTKTRLWTWPYLLTQTWFKVLFWYFLLRYIDVANFVSTGLQIKVPRVDKRCYIVITNIMIDLGLD